MTDTTVPEVLKLETKPEPKHYTMELAPGNMVLVLQPMEPPKEPDEGA